jgi:hypothetical protein
VEVLIGGPFDGRKVDGRKHVGHVILEMKIGSDEFARYRRGKKGTWEFVETCRVRRAQS